MRTLGDLRAWASAAPAGTMLPVAQLADLLEHIEHAPAPSVDELQAPVWRVVLWTAPAEVRLGRDELLEATGRPRSWLYRHTGEKAVDRIPHRRHEGELIFLCGELRHWLRQREQIVEAGLMDTGSTLRSVKGGR